MACHYFTGRKAPYLVTHTIFTGLDGPLWIMGALFDGAMLSSPALPPVGALGLFFLSSLACRHSTTPSLILSAQGSFWVVVVRMNLTPYWFKDCLFIQLWLQGKAHYNTSSEETLSFMECLDMLLCVSASGERKRNMVKSGART
jgi:hypothetical protein